MHSSQSASGMGQYLSLGLQTNINLQKSNLWNSQTPLRRCCIEGPQYNITKDLDKDLQANLNKFNKNLQDLIQTYNLAWANRIQQAQQKEYKVGLRCFQEEAGVSIIHTIYGYL